MLSWDNAGHFVPPGRVCEQIAAESWGWSSLTPEFVLRTDGNNAGSSISFVGADTSECYFQLNTAVATSGRATLQGPLITLADKEALAVTLQGVYFGPTDNVVANLGFWSDDIPQTAGCRIRGQASDSSTSMVAFKAAGGTADTRPLPYNWMTTTDWTQKRDLTLMLSRERNVSNLPNGDVGVVWWSYLMEPTFDDVYFMWRMRTDDSTAPGGGMATNLGTATAVRPKFEINCETGSAGVWARVERMVVRKWTF